jgi:cellulose synthase/poly-beta-1,6-N-acetylglucosamine synthase-like glycosyltransferase
MVFFVLMWNLVSIAIVALLTGAYMGLIFYYRGLFKKVKPFVVETGSPVTKFSIIIPARNEEAVIGACIESIYKQDYPSDLFEVIVIDDHSTDHTSGVVTKYQKEYATLKLIRLQEAIEGKLLNAYKKKAIETAIPRTSGDWILTTDADCSVTGQWLRSYDGYIRQNDPALVAGPVKFINNGSFVSVFQCLDFLSLQGVTAAVVSADKHSMCNGANLAYSKSAFIAVNGFKGIDNIASGDDMLLMHKIKKQFPGKLGYVFTPGAIVRTTPMPDWKSFLNQRIRWASKAEKYDDKSIIMVLAMVYFYNVTLLVLGVLAFVNPFYITLLLVSLGAKIFAELSFMIPAAGFYKERKLLWWFPFMQPFHIVYIIVAGWLGKFGSYQWKGRKVK